MTEWKVEYAFDVNKILDAQRVVAAALKRRFGNLTVDEVNTLAGDILKEVLTVLR